MFHPDETELVANRLRNVLLKSIATIKHKCIKREANNFK